MKARNDQVINKLVLLTLSVCLFLLTGSLHAAPPVVTASAPTFGLGGTVVNLTGSAVDPEDSELTFLWTQTQGDTAAISDADQPETSFLAPFVAAQQTFIFRLTVTNAENESAFADVTLDIGFNDRPVASIFTLPATVLEGSTVTIGGQGFFLGERLTNLSWEQLNDPKVPLSSTSEEVITFVAPEINNNAGTNEKIELEFQLTVTPDNSDAIVDTVIITVEDNGITGLDGFIPTQTADQKPFGAIATTGDLVGLAAINFNNATNNVNRPRDTPLGLIKLVATPDQSGAAVIELKLTETIPAEFVMFSYSDASGWQQLANSQFSFNAARDLITLRLQDVAGSTNAGDRDDKEGLIEIITGPGQVSPRVVASSTIGGGTLGIWSLIIFGVLGISSILIGFIKSKKKAAGSRLTSRMKEI